MEDKWPLVSIIIPTYNRANLIGETLESIDNQIYKHWECIVVDDGSTDNTKVIVDEFVKNNTKFSYLSRPKSMAKGANSCRNYGYEKSKGLLINWFDSDDIMHPRKLEIQVGHLESTKFQFTVCQTLVFKHHIDNIIGLRCGKIYSKSFFGDFVTNKIKWLTQAPLFKRQFIDAHMLRFDETLSQSQERDFFIRVLDIVNDYHYDDTPLVYFREHNDSISHSAQTKDMLKSNFKVNYRALDIYGDKLNDSEKKVLKKGIKQVLKKTIQNKYFKLSNEILKKMYFHLSFRERLKIRLGVLLLKNIGKGDVLFN
ncbi:glycosyltransferase family 2 protein [Winogradskyella flava]|uniref:Glycosyltransferase family 2 protein n=1 Tax=Winogradskyella flava TaxID=1884876 RepID=A0A842ITJ7_9FLAO|nr:glycosyltransferase family 2 protein [Winogradskyella flava]MBC2846105.1 glycosyltransferase family 2 protein [Winogradskyella flava]